jgi:hypothetical protein
VDECVAVLNLNEANGLVPVHVSACEGILGEVTNQRMGAQYARYSNNVYHSYVCIPGRVNAQISMTCDYKIRTLSAV